MSESSTVETTVEVVASPREPVWRPDHPTRILGWVYLGRIAIGVALLLRLPLDPFAPGPDNAYVVTLLAATAMFTAGSYLHTHRRAHGVGQRRLPGQSFIYAQVLFDALLLTVLVYLSGGPRSIYTPLYILVISAGALLLPFVGGILIGLFAGLLYLAAAVASFGTADATILLQGGLFAVVAVVTGLVGDRLRQTGTALDEVQTELRRLQLDTNDILESIGTGVLTVDGFGRLAYLNPAAAEILGIRSVDWLDRPILGELDRIAPGLGSVIQRTATVLMPIRRFETSPVTPESFILGVSTTLVERHDGGRPAVTVIFQNITEKMRVEGLRRRAERLEAVAELSASLAHEIRNPLASIRSAVEQIAGDQVDADDAELLGGLIVRETDRVTRLLGEFIDFARVKLMAPRPIDFTELVQGVVDVVRNHPDARESDVAIRVALPDEPVFVRGAEDLLHRAILNLMLNAAQWAGSNGIVEVAVDELQTDLLSPASGALRVARLSVSDSGPGIPEDIRESIFDPFFTRRPGGTGLGLALAQRSVEAHGGGIFVDRARTAGGGAAFSLYLPVLVSDLADENMTLQAPLMG